MPIRVFHWALVAGVVAAYLSAKLRYGDVHVLVGYGLCILLCARVLWGVVGSRYARFASFFFSWRETLAYLRAMLRGKPRHYAGHNPAGAVMVFALLLLLAAIFLTGLLTLATIDFDGPLLAFAKQFGDEGSYRLRHLHGWLVDLGIALVALHVAGVLWGSYQHEENLVKAMITGNKVSESEQEICQ